MFQRMLQGSQAVLLRPSVATFAQYERDDLRGALGYVLLGALLAGVLGSIGAAPGGSGSLILAAPLVFLIYTICVQAIGRVLGGGGSSGRLAYDIALFWTPLLVLGMLVSLVATGPLAILNGFVGLAFWVYSFYLTYLCVQSGLQLSPGRALLTTLIPFLPLLLLNIGLALLV